MLKDIIEYYLTHTDSYWMAVGTHILMSGGVGLAAAVIGIPLGILCARHPRYSQYITGAVNIMRVVPSLALMIVLIPLIGIGKVPAVIALMVIAIPPILINTMAGFTTADSSLLEAARGMGMDEKQVFWKIQIPLAIPLIFTGIRTSIVETIASATIATYIGAGGLGNIVFTGLGVNKTYIIVVGGLSIAILSIAADYLLGAVQRNLEKRFGRNV